MALFFISYKRNETSKAFAEDLRRHLQNEPGFTVWMDTDIEPGSEWKIVIDNAINDSIAVLVVITPESLKSQYVTYEWSYALGKGKRVIPILLEALDPNNPNHPKIHPKLDDIQRGTEFTNYPASIREEDWRNLIAILKNVKTQDYIPDDIAEAKRMLASADPEQQDRAIRHLAEAKTEYAQTALVEFVGHTNQRINKWVSYTLAEYYSDKRAIPGLSSALLRNDTSHEDKFMLINCLKNLKSTDGLNSLLETLKDTEQDIRIREFSLRAMTEIGGEDAVEELINFLEIANIHTDRAIATKVVVTLNGFGSTKAIPVLKAIQKREIGEIGPDGKIERKSDLDQFNLNVLVTLRQLGDEEGTRLYNWYMSPPRV